MKAHPYFSYLIIPLFKKKFDFIFLIQGRKWIGENPGKNKHVFLRSLDFLMTKRETQRQKRPASRETHVIGYQRVAEKNQRNTKRFTHLGPQMNCVW